MGGVRQEGRRQENGARGGDDAKQSAVDGDDQHHGSAEGRHRSLSRRTSRCRQASKRTSSLGMRRRSDDRSARRASDGRCIALGAQAPAAKKPSGSLSPIEARAARIHRQAIVVDTHIDTTQMLAHRRLGLHGDAPGTAAAVEPDTNASHVDLPRAREGGLERRLLLDLHARHHHRSRSREARARDDRQRPPPGRTASRPRSCWRRRRRRCGPRTRRASSRR